jgi:hypothetical protein
VWLKVMQTSNIKSISKAIAQGAAFSYIFTAFLEQGAGDALFNFKIPLCFLSSLVSLSFLLSSSLCERQHLIVFALISDQTEAILNER